MRILLIGASPECDYNTATMYIHAYLQNDEKIRDHCTIENLTYRMKSYYEEIVSCMAHLGNPNLNLFINKMCKDIIDSGAEICGWSCYIWNVDLFMRVIGALKKLKPSIKHIVGGPEFFSHELEKVLRRNPSVDVVVKGEGETTMKELIYHYLDQSLKLEDIAGIAYLDKVGQYHETPNRAALRDLSTIPSPFMTGVWKSRIRSVMVETYRGCPYDCYFCLYGKMMGQNIRYFPIQQVKDEILWFLENDVVMVFFLDAVFNIEPQRTHEILELIINNYNGITTFEFQVKLETLDKKSIDLIGQLYRLGGIKRLEIGIQAYQPEARKNINRHFDEQTFRRNFSLLSSQVKSDIQIDFIWGMPGDNYESFKKGLDFGYSLGGGKGVWLATFACHVVPGAGLEHSPEELEVRWDDCAGHQMLSTKSYPIEEILQTEYFVKHMNEIQRSKFFNWDLEEGTTFSQLVEEYMHWAHYQDPLMDRDKLCMKFFVQRYFSKLFGGKKTQPVSAGASVS